MVIRISVVNQGEGLEVQQETKIHILERRVLILNLMIVIQDKLAKRLKQIHTTLKRAPQPSILLYSPALAPPAVHLQVKLPPNNPTQTPTCVPLPRWKKTSQLQQDQHMKLSSNLIHILADMGTKVKKCISTMSINF